jgi:cytoskeleton protein RodZ
MSSEDADSHTNPEIGRSLERARTERGLSLWQVEEATKIRVRYLRDLERENFDVLPAVYVLGSLKTYADFLGLDGEALSRQLKDRQASLQQEEDPADEEPVSVERGGLPVIGDRGALEDDEDVAAPATATGQSPRLYLGLGAVLILVLAVALTMMLGGGDQPAVSQLREPAITEPPSWLVASGNVEDPKEGARKRAAGSGNDRSEAGVESSDERDTKDDQEGQEQTKKGEGDEDDVEPEVAQDVEITPPSASTASAGTASASASATAASATSAAFATAPADASSTVSAPASGAPVAPDAAAPQAANAGVAPRPAVDQPAPGADGAPAGARRVVVADGAGPVERVVYRVRIVRFR